MTAADCLSVFDQIASPPSARRMIRGDTYFGTSFWGDDPSSSDSERGLAPWPGVTARDPDGPEDSEEDLLSASNWVRLVARLGRLAFKRRCWNCLGAHLRFVRARGLCE